MTFYLLSTLDMVSFLIPIILVGIFYYVYIYKPQREKKAMLSSLSIGSKIITRGGLLGTIVSFGEQYCIIELYDGTQACVLRESITQQIQ